MFEFGLTTSVEDGIWIGPAGAAAGAAIGFCNGEEVIDKAAEDAHKSERTTETRKESMGPSECSRQNPGAVPKVDATDRQIRKLATLLCNQVCRICGTLCDTRNG